MARLEGSAVTNAQAIGAATVETLIQLLAPANTRVPLIGYGIGAHGVNNLDEPGTVDILRQTTAGTASALTPNKLQDTLSETLLTAAQDTFTVEPTPGDLLRTHTVHPQAGLDISDDYAREPIAGGAGRIAIRAEFAQVQTLDAYLTFEE